MARAIRIEQQNFAALSFFSVEYAGRGDLFEELSVWEDEKFRRLRGTYPVIRLSLACPDKPGGEADV